MNILIVVDEPDDWALEIPEAKIIAARSYLNGSGFHPDPPATRTVGRSRAAHKAGQGMSRSVKLFNLCKSYRYQSSGYYVSLLAEARGHKPLPTVGAIEDLHNQALVRHLTEDLSSLIQRLLAPLTTDEFELCIYFGRDTGDLYHPLSRELFALLQVPMLAARFQRHNNQWSLRSVRAIGASDLPPGHHEFVTGAAREYFTGRMRWSKKRAPRFDLAILYDPDDPEPPSNAKALEKFKSAAEELSMRVEFIGRSDISRLPQFDALFIRDTTFVNHYTYRFSRRAVAEGLVVIDAPDSILKCSNKVYLAELFAQHGIETPKTLLVHRDNIAEIVPELGLPCVLKQPDSAFSRGVVKVETEAELMPLVSELLTKSALIIAQEWLPTEFDWRVGILDRRVLFVAKYFFPSGHWQVVRRDSERRKLSEGPTQAVPVDEAPKEVVRIALKSANLIGESLYGVDVKQVGKRCYVIEVNDNPNVDAGNEDGVIKDALYREVMSVFLKRIEARKQNHAR
ncbi:glutathione synthase/RimK-type ligase-like ATP-grasp enzyme [Nitrosospira sp. Nsp2]|uniref:RimK family protein n=1 Tax=Nitrosospira sp. Nsp2 TaxID=136548 RepID=UPI000D3198E4|nr:RimK family protein [Nitrosospira sp. Nsp2]PTR17423.1 glutathione synthase/RimK-type ligase-like ATP-grasp enzyme [Nitrosospira sp. Nsp2]